MWAGIWFGCSAEEQSEELHVVVPFWVGDIDSDWVRVSCIYL